MKKICNFFMVCILNFVFTLNKGFLNKKSGQNCFCPDLTILEYNSANLFAPRL